MVELNVTFLGTSSAAPTKDRGLPAIAIQREGEVVLLDCGEGVQRQVLGRGIGLNREMAILVTHLHGDHVTGLLGLLQTMGLSQRRRLVTIVGPPNLLKWLQATSELLSMGLTFQVKFIPAKPGSVVRLKSFKVKIARAYHSVEAYSYIVEEHPRHGVFYPEKAKKLKVPEGDLWSKLQRGSTVSVNGRKVESKSVTGPPRPGRKVGYSGDTRPDPHQARFFRDCDLLIFDSTFKGADRVKAVERKHSTSIEAAEVAKKAGAKRLALTHFSARYSQVSSLVKEARAVFPNTFAASDGMRVSVGYPSS